MSQGVVNIVILFGAFQLIAGTCIGPNSQGIWYDETKGGVPSDAIPGGHESKGELVYICKANDIPGKLVKSKKTCEICDNKKVKIIKKKFQVLTSVQGVWVPLFGKALPCNALPMSSEPIYSGRATIKKTLTVGKVVDSIAYVPYSGKEQVVLSGFEVFTSTMRTAQVDKSWKFYDLSGEYLSFRVKCGNDVFITFGNKCRHVQFILRIGNITSMWKNGSSYKVSSLIEGALSPNVYNGFWIHIDGEVVRFGIEDNLTAKLVFTDPGVKGLNLISLSSIEKSQWYIPDLKDSYPILDQF